MKEKTSITSSLSNKGSLTDAEINAGFGFNTILKSPDLNGQLYDIDSQVDIITKEICNFLTGNGVTINSGDNSQLATLMSSLLSAKQNTLVAGTGITIDENGVISAQASTPANIPLFFYTWLDSLPFNVSWVNASNYSWLYGSTYVGAYNRLKSQLNPVGTFSAGDTYYVCNFSDGSMQTTTVLIGGATVAQLEAWCSAQGYTYSGATIEEFKCYKTVSASSETIEGITITYYQTNDGKKIVTSDAEIANAESIYNATGVQWYYILDTTNQRFKLPRINPAKKEQITLMRAKGNEIAVGLTDGTLYAGLQRGSVSNSENCLAAAPNGYGETVGTANSNRTGLANNILAGITTDPTKSGIVIDPADSDTVFAGSKYLYFYLGSADVEETANIAGIKAETINNKADISLNNINPSASAKEMIVGWGMPDYSAGVEKTRGVDFTVSQNSVLWITTDDFSTKSYIYINDVPYVIGGGFSSYSAIVQSSFVPVPTGTKIKVVFGRTYSGDLNKIICFPCIGG